MFQLFGFEIAFRSDRFILIEHHWLLNKALVWSCSFIPNNQPDLKCKLKPIVIRHGMGNNLTEI